MLYNIRHFEYNELCDIFATSASQKIADYVVIKMFIAGALEKATDMPAKLNSSQRCRHAGGEDL